MVDIVTGALAGGVIAAVVAVNIVIYSGIERGYEATIPEVFRQSPIVGITTVAILAAGPILGVLAARRIRHRRKGD